MMAKRINMAKPAARKFFTPRLQLIASVLLWVSPVLVLAWLINQNWFWAHVPKGDRHYAGNLPWVNVVLGLLALMVAWLAGERFILRQVRELTKAVEQF